MSKRKGQCRRPPCVRQRAAAKIAAELQGRIDALEYALRVVVERAVSAERRAVRAEYALALSEKRVSALEAGLAKPSVVELLRRISDGTISALIREADAADEESNALVNEKTNASAAEVHDSIELESRADGIRHALRALGLIEARA